MTTHETERRSVIGMALYGDLTYDSRVRREAASLASSGRDVVLVCLSGSGDGPDLPDNVRVVAHEPRESVVLPGSDNPFGSAKGGVASRVMGRVRWLRGYVGTLRSWGRAVPVVAGQVDAWHLHDLTALVGVAPHVGQDVPIVYDSHELYLEAGTALRLPGPMRTFLRAYERRLVGRAAAVVTVNDAVASILARRYRPRRMTVIYNCPDRWAVPDARPELIRRAAGIPDGAPIILYHGTLVARRGIERLMESMLEPGLETAHLVLLGFGDKQAEFAETARESRWHGRIHLLDAVTPDALLDWIASADVGAMPIEASEPNLYLSTPNKLFECLAAGVPVVGSDFPGIRRIIMDDPAGPLGAVCDPSSPGSIAAALRSVLDGNGTTPPRLRARCLEAARARWNWETESRKLTDLYDEILGDVATLAESPTAQRM